MIAFLGARSLVLNFWPPFNDFSFWPFISIMCKLTYIVRGHIQDAAKSSFTNKSNYDPCILYDTMAIKPSHHLHKYSTVCELDTQG